MVNDDLGSQPIILNFSFKSTPEYHYPAANSYFLQFCIKNSNLFSRIVSEQVISFLKLILEKFKVERSFFKML